MLLSRVKWGESNCVGDFFGNVAGLIGCAKCFVCWWVVIVDSLFDTLEESVIVLRWSYFRV